MSSEKEILPHQQRVIDEKTELDGKIGKLITFVKTDLFNGLMKEDALLLSDQLFVMQAYRDILTKRIARF